MEQMLWVTFWGAMLGYAGCVLASGIRMTRGKGITRTSTLFLFIACLLHAGHYGCRWIDQGQPPMVRQADLFVLLSLVGVILFLWMGRTLTSPSVSGWVSLGALILLAWQSFEAKEVRPLVPALRSAWLTIHVFFCMVAYAALLLGSLGAAWSLIRRSRAGAEMFSERMIRIGTCFLTLGIVTGSVWAQRAWGRYWGWDPKETASLITWLVYLAYLHVPKNDANVRRASVLAVVGLLSVLFTWFGVALLPGLHSYQ